jgi:mono/diheme cytochrome c family protein
MNKALKIIAIIIGSVFFIWLCFYAYIYYDGIPKYEANPPSITVTADSAMIAEGRRHAQMVCNQCHMGKNGTLEGAEMQDIPAIFGQAWAANITKHEKYGVGRYTDGELIYLLRTGIKRDGNYAPPWMPKFPHLSDSDMHNIVAYLRSDAPELAPSDTLQPPSRPSWLAKFLAHVAFKPLPYPTGPIQAPPITDKVAYGKYLAVGKVDCYGCHSPDFKNIDIMNPEATPGYFSGGNPMPNKEKEIVHTRNLTPDKATGIGNWTEAQFIKAVKHGLRDGKPALQYPMTPYTQLTDEEASAIWAYLQTIPAIHHDIDSLVAAQ